MVPLVSRASNGAPRSKSMGKTSEFPPAAAVTSTGRPFSSIVFASAPCSSSVQVTAGVDAIEADKAVNPAPLLAFTVAPLAASAQTTSRCPLTAAPIRGVTPRSSGLFASAPPANNASTASMCPSIAAASSGVTPPRVRSFELAPFCSNKRTTAPCPCVAAITSTVASSL